MIVNFSINTTANEIDTLIYYKLKQHYTYTYTGWCTIYFMKCNRLFSFVN